MGLRLLIVDDERITRESLTKFIDWKSLGITCDCASNGVEAISVMEKTHIDILLTDVKMPHMDGIQLATQVREKYPDCKIIFLSGYTDKEYLKSAISLKVESYVEKPIDPEELTSIISKTITSIHTQSEMSNISSVGLYTSSRMIRQEIAVLLVSSQGGYAEVYSRFYPLYFSWDKDRRIVVMCLHIGGKPIDGALMQEIISIFYDIVDKNHQTESYIGAMPQFDIACILKEVPIALIFSIFRSIQQTMKEKFGVIISGGLSDSGKVSDIMTSWKIAHFCCEKRFYLGTGNLVVNAKTGQSLPSSVFEVLPKNYDESIQLFQKLAEYKCDDIQWIKHNLYRFYLAMMDRTVNTHTISEDVFCDYTLSEVEELILYGMHVFKTLGNNQYAPKIKETIHFILWNYSDMNLSIKMLADAMGLSQNYLCNLFKQNTGTTINNFIVDVRIEKAKKLLRTTDDKLYEIAHKVGLNDPNYLCVVFKNRCGETPSKYREDARREV